MNFKLKNGLNYNKTMLALSVIALLAGVISAFFGEPFVFVSAASLGILFVFESDKKRIYSIATSVLILVAAFVIGGWSSLIGVEICAIALTAYICFAKKREKGECAMIMTAIVTVLTVISLYLAAAQAISDMSITAVIGFYNDMFAKLKDNIVSNFREYIKAFPDAYKDSDAVIGVVTNMINSMINTVISIIVIVAFAISGLTLKLFDSMYYRLTDDTEEPSSWIFTTSNVFAYFYIALTILSFFVSYGTDAFSITVTNLHNVFTVVYAYIGFRELRALLSAKLSPAKAWIILIIAFVIGSAFAVTLLSVFGVYVTIASNRFKSLGANGGDENDDGDGL